MSNLSEAGFTPQIQIADLVGIPPQEWVFLPSEVVNDPDWHRLNEQYWEEHRASQETALKEAGRPDQIHPRLSTMDIIQLISTRPRKQKPPKTQVTTWLVEKDRHCFWHTLTSPDDADPIVAKLALQFPGYRMRTKILKSITNKRLLVEVSCLISLHPLTQSLGPIPSHRDQLGLDKLAHEIFDGYVDPDSITAELLINTLVQQGRFRVYPRSFR